MKLLSRDFTRKEKVLLLLLVLVLLGLAYYQFIDQPVRNAIEEAQAEKAALEIELQAVQSKVAQLERMQAELDRITGEDGISQMPSYNNAKAVNRLLNDILGDLGYTITFSNVTRSGDQIRRNISLQFTAPDYAAMQKVLTELTSSDYRCLIDNVSCTLTNRYYDHRVLENLTQVTTSLTATFYETMVGGTPDAGLPVEKPAET